MTLRGRILPGADRILDAYYGVSHLPLVLDCLRPPVASLGDGGRVLFREGTDEGEGGVELGLEFGASLHARLDADPGPLRMHDLAVAAEELSHMNTIIDACAVGGGISLLDLEILGEIDRFLVLMHWDATAPERRLEAGWRNLDGISDSVFSGPRFAPEADAKLYVLAEECAFAHLRRAFGRGWEASRLDLGRVDPDARRYLLGLRNDVLAGGRPARRLAQSA